MKTHSPDKCAGSHCCIHNPSDHHMVTWPQKWRGDIGIMERICPHGIGHPDPDCIYAKREGMDIHSCDGCCSVVTPSAEHDAFIKQQRRIDELEDEVRSLREELQVERSKR